MKIHHNRLFEFPNHTAYQIEGDSQDTFRVIQAYGEGVESFLREKHKIRKIFKILNSTAPRS